MIKNKYKKETINSYMVIGMNLNKLGKKYVVIIQKL